MAKWRSWNPRVQWKLQTTKGLLFVKVECAIASRSHENLPEAWTSQLCVAERKQQSKSTDGEELVKTKRGSTTEVWCVAKRKRTDFEAKTPPPTPSICEPAPLRRSVHTKSIHLYYHTRPQLITRCTTTCLSFLTHVPYSLHMCIPSIEWRRNRPHLR